MSYRIGNYPLNLLPTKRHVQPRRQFSVILLVVNGNQLIHHTIIHVPPMTCCETSSWSDHVGDYVIHSLIGLIKTEMSKRWPSFSDSAWDSFLLMTIFFYHSRLTLFFYQSGCFQNYPVAHLFCEAFHAINKNTIANCTQGDYMIQSLVISFSFLFCYSVRTSHQIIWCPCDFISNVISCSVSLVKASKLPFKAVHTRLEGAVADGSVSSDFPWAPLVLVDWS